MKNEKLSFVSNAPNLTQNHHIKNFYAVCKAKYSNHQSKTKIIQNFCRTWTKTGKKQLWQNPYGVHSKKSVRGGQKLYQKY